MYDQVGDVCFTPDGIARKGVLIRHLVMPGLEEEGKSIVTWLAENVSKDLYIHIMEQYHPRAHVGKTRRTTKKSENKEGSQLRYQEINRAISDEELTSIKAAAEKAGLWRFVAASGHGGFNI